MQVYMNLQQEVSPSPQVPFGPLLVWLHPLISATADRLLQMSMELKILVVAHEGMDLRFSPWCSWSRGAEVYPWCLEREGGVLWIVAKGVAETMFPLCFCSCSCYTADMLTERESSFCVRVAGRWRGLLYAMTLAWVSWSCLTLKQKLRSKSSRGKVASVTEIFLDRKKGVKLNLIYEDMI